MLSGRPGPVLTQTVPAAFNDRVREAEKPQSVHTLSDQSPPEETDADDRKHYSDVNVTEHDSNQQ